MEYENYKEYRKAMRADVKGRRKANKEKEKISEAEAKKSLDQLSPEERAEVKAAQKAAEQAQKVAEKTAAAERKKLLEKQKFDKCGDVMTSQTVGLNIVTIYEKGYIEIGGILLGGIPAKLLGISSNLNTKKKNIVGGNKGMALLTIVTDSWSQVIKVDSPKDSDINAIVELEGVGKAAIELGAAIAESSAIEPTSKSLPTSVADELIKLAELKKSGALTASEYSAAKKRLLA